LEEDEVKRGTIQNCVKKFEIGLATLTKFAVVMETSKKIDTIDTSKFPQKVNEQLLNVSAPYSQLSYQNFKKKLMGVASSFLPPPLYVCG